MAVPRKGIARAAPHINTAYALVKLLDRMSAQGHVPMLNEVA